MAKNNPNEFLMDLTVATARGPRRIKVIVLNETDKAVVYIPLKSITRVDYDRLKKIYEKAELDMLTTLRDEKLDNGRNALVTYQHIIEVYNKPQPKEEPEPDALKDSTDDQKESKSEEQPARKKPGRPPKKKVEDQ